MILMNNFLVLWEVENSTKKLIMWWILEWCAPFQMLIYFKSIFLHIDSIIVTIMWVFVEEFWC